MFEIPSQDPLDTSPNSYTKFDSARLRWASPHGENVPTSRPLELPVVSRPACPPNPCRGESSQVRILNSADNESPLHASHALVRTTVDILRPLLAYLRTAQSTSNPSFRRAHRCENSVNWRLNRKIMKYISHSIVSDR
jgi:hypothetical protein